MNHEPLLQIARQFMFFSKSDFNHTEGSIFDKQKLYPGALSTMYMYVLSFNNLRTDNECMDESTMPFTKNQTQPNVLLRCSYFSDIEKYCRKKIILLKLSSKLLIFSNFMRYLVLWYLSEAFHTHKIVFVGVREENFLKIRKVSDWTQKIN